MHAMPSFADLQQATGSHFQLWISDEQALAAQLLVVTEGPAMSPRHQRYAAEFALPAGTVLPQALFRLSPPGEQGWLLLMTPVGPDSDGRPVLEAIFHVERPL
ncbi:DUF6916 family protein [Pseudomonas carassii]|uniref:DUF6916 domain-containing protein n=1 Tax=Pseudomonas carassii TaxID=3115855 RepID=A0ABU7HDA3_9PSED|nr:hypothetical protein [Pseudomonas sp. 137P]MEE1889301.1 hypothetical protein [Pseudomonas sp. 137P]